MTSIFALSIPITLILGSFAVYMSYQNITDTLAQTLKSSAVISATAAENEISEYGVIVQGIASQSAVYSEDEQNGMSLGDFLSWMKTSYGMEDVTVYSLNGKSATGGKAADDSLLKVALGGEVYLGSPYLHPDTGVLCIDMAAPIWKDGTAGTKVSGVLSCSLPQSFINTIAEKIQMSQNSHTRIINAQGVTIASTMAQEAKDGQNISSASAGQKELGEMIAAAIAGKSGFGTYKQNGKTQYAAYAPIEGTGGWSILINAPSGDFNGGVIKTSYISAALALVFITYGLCGSLILSKGIVNPMMVSVDRVMLMADGDFTSPVPEIVSKSRELHRLRDRIAHMCSSTSEIISDIKFVLEEMSNGNFTVESDMPERYIGDYSEILIAENIIKNNLAKTLNEINSIAEQVSGGADQVSSGAQALAQGATEQASSVEELSATINEIAAQVRRSAEESEKANELTVQTGEIVQGSVEGMSQVSSAMDEISEASRNISR
ncbi:MAG: methyl-accepting chemotaxis protein, partial [Clostridiales bacterium]|nr:methyl-accepting chemotaxis protein [Clostridiales bacterium]